TSSVAWSAPARCAPTHTVPSSSPAPPGALQYLSVDDAGQRESPPSTHPPVAQESLFARVRQDGQDGPANQPVSATSYPPPFLIALAFAVSPWRRQCSIPAEAPPRRLPYMGGSAA